MREKHFLPICVLCIFLSLLMFFYCFPIGAFSFSDAIGEEGSDITTESSLLSMDGTFEVTELRQENVKHFRLPDGSYIAAQYDTAVHYQDADGAWRDIDNTLTSLGGAYVTENGFSVAFPKKSDIGIPLFSVDDGKHRFSFSLEENTNRTVAVVENPTELSDGTDSYRELSTLYRLTSSVRYTDILEGVDIEYVLVGDRIYENIMLKDLSADSSYTFRLSMEGLALSTEEGGEIVLSDSENGEEIFTIPASFMTDSSTYANMSMASVGSYSEEVSYMLAYDGNDVLLTISADEDWLSDTARTYPVTVDPPVFTGGSESSEDTYISSEAPHGNMNDSPSLYAGRYFDENRVIQEDKAFWKASTFPVLPAGSVIIGASLMMQESSLIEATNTEEPLLVTASCLIDSFNADTVTWLNAPPASNVVLDYAYRPEADSAGYRFWSWNISNVVEGWMSGELENNGICLSMYGNALHHVGFYSCDAYYVEGSVSVYAPTLQISYRSALGMDSLYSYTNVSSAAGTAYISDAMGSVAVVTPTVASGNAFWNYVPAVLYRSQKAGSPYLAKFEDEAYVCSVAGSGFMVDFEELIHVVYIESTFDAPGKDYIVYLDSNGTEHYF